MTRTVRDTGRTGRAEKAAMEAARDATGVPRHVGYDKKQWELGGPGVFSFPEYEHYRGQLENDEWITDCIPQFMDGKNVADFYDPDIEAKLKVGGEGDVGRRRWRRRRSSWRRSTRARRSRRRTRIMRRG